MKLKSGLMIFLIPICITATTLKIPNMIIMGESQKASAQIPGSFEKITSTNIQDQNPKSTVELLNAIPGISITEEDSLGLRPNISIRGVYGNRSRKVLTLEDDVPVSLAPYGENASYYTPQIDSIDTIEIIKGSGSILYGPQTIGGVINYRTAPISIDPFHQFTAQFSAPSDHSTQYQFGQTFENAGLGFDLLYKNGKGQRIMPYTLYDLRGKSTLYLDDHTTATAKIHYFNEESNSTYVGLTQSLYGSDEWNNPAEDDTLFVERFDFSLNLDKELNETDSEKSILYATYTTRDWWRQDFSRTSSTDAIRFSGPSGKLDGSTLYWKNSNGGRNRNYRVIGLERRYKFKTLQLGGKIHYETEDNKRINGESSTARSGLIKSDETRSTLALSSYIQKQWNVSPKLLLTTGLRAETFKQNRNIYRNNNAISSTNASAENKTVLIPGIGINYNPNENTEIFGGIHRGFAPPRFSDAIDSSGTDQKLDAEESWNTEIGIRTHLSNQLYTEATAFYYDYRNQIVAASESSGVSKANAGKSLNQGVEASLTYETQNIVIPNSALKTTLSGSFIDAKYKSGTYNGNKIPYVPEQQASLSFRYSLPESTILNLQALYQGSVFADEANTTEASNDGTKGLLSGRTLFNANIQHPITSQWTGFVSIKNIFDTTYISSRNPKGIFPGLRRQINMGVTFTL